jgi:hypothetical protein
MAQDLIHSHPYVLSQDELGLHMMTIEEWESSKALSQSVRQIDF